MAQTTGTTTETPETTTTTGTAARTDGAGAAGMAPDAAPAPGSAGTPDPAGQTAGRAAEAREERAREAIRAMRAQGERVTVKGVREALGSGSYTVLSPLVRRLRAEEEERERAEARAPDMPEAVAALMRTVWSEACRHADEGAAAARQAHAAETGRLRAEIAEREEETGAVKEERDAALARAGAAEDALAECDAGLAAIRLVLARLEGRLAERGEREARETDEPEDGAEAADGDDAAEDDAAEDDAAGAGDEVPDIARRRSGAAPRRAGPARRARKDSRRAARGRAGSGRARPVEERGHRDDQDGAHEGDGGDGGGSDPAAIRTRSADIGTEHPEPAPPA